MEPIAVATSSKAYVYRWTFRLQVTGLYHASACSFLSVSRLFVMFFVLSLTLRLLEPLLAYFFSLEEL